MNNNSLNPLSKVSSNAPIKGNVPAPPKNKLNFKKMKKNTVASLNEVEYFLCNFKKCCNYIKLYKILK